MKKKQVKQDKSKQEPIKEVGLQLEAGVKKHRMVPPPKVGRNF